MCGTRMSCSRGGLSLIEVIVAIAILAIGVLAAALFQTSTLRTNTDASLRVQATRIATTEMELRRQTFYDPADEDEAPRADGTIPCRTAVAGFECSAVVQNCELAVALAGSSLDCASAGAEFTTYQISVRVTDPRGGVVEVASLSPAYRVFGTITPVGP